MLYNSTFQLSRNSAVHPVLIYFNIYMGLTNFQKTVRLLAHPVHALSCSRDMHVMQGMTIFNMNVVVVCCIASNECAERTLSS